MKLLKIIIPCLFLGACMFGASKSSKFYTQAAAVANTVSANYNGFVGVNRIHLPKYVDRPQMITQEKDSVQVNISEYNRWVEAPSVLATRAVAADLSALLPAAKIKINPLQGDAFERVVSVEVEEITAVLGEKVTLSAWYKIQDNAKKLIAQQKFSYTVPIGKTYEDVANGYSRLWAALSEDIANTLIRN